MNFYSGGTYTGTDSRYYGMSIRPIRAEKAERVAHEWVDLGLPSGTLWATFNVGASTPEEYGDYFAWGETEPKEEYSWETYKLTSEPSLTFEYINKYTVEDDWRYYSWYNRDGEFIGDGLTELLPEDDAATVNWGSEWQTPSYEQTVELLNNTTQQWTTQNGVNGTRLISNVNGESIFLPAAGQYRDKTLRDEGSYCVYWTRTLTGETYMVFGLGLASIGRVPDCYPSRYYGICVRPVRKILASAIVLDKTQLNLDADKGQTAQLTATVQPANFVSNKKVTWESSDNYVASVDQTGLVKAITPGTCTITCRATDGSGVKAECYVIVGGTSGGGGDWD
jgi:hypothetical protein